MSAPFLINRSWDRKTYYAMRRFWRYVWWKNKYDEKIIEAAKNALLYGTGYLRME